MQRKNIGLVLIAVGLVLMGVSFVYPLSISGRLYLESIAINLYYESADAKAPVTLKWSGVWTYYKAKASSGWYAGLKGVYSGYRTISAKVTLKIGEQYSETRYGDCKVSWKSGASKCGDYALVVWVQFAVPASKVVPYMKLKIDPETGEPKPDEGTSPLSVSCNIAISGVTYHQIHSYEGVANIRIVGDVSDYLTDEPPTHNDGDNEPSPNDTQDSDDNGGSQVTVNPPQHHTLTWIGLALTLIGIGIAVSSPKRNV